MKNIFLMLLLVLPTMLNAAFFNAKELLNWCEGNVEKINLCKFYLAGIQDAHDAFVGWDRKSNHCVPDNITADQLRKIFIKYANDYPQGLHNSAGNMALNAFFHAFPCK